MKQTFVFLFFSLIQAPQSLRACPSNIYLCAQDTIVGHDLQHVEVYGNQKNRSLRSSVPFQILSKNELKKLPALQVSDVVKHFAGVQVKDYGGIGGLKTVSVRGLGSQHTAVAYDGIVMADGQTGQIDLGKFSLDQVQSVSLVNAQSDDLLQTARALASGAVLSLETGLPDFQKTNTFSVYSSLKGGSWGLLQPALSLAYTGKKQCAGGISAEWMQTDGHYPFTLRYGADGALTERKKRNNTDVKTVRLEGSAAKQWDKGGTLHARAYYFRSRRGLPGATVYYYEHAAQRLDDDQLFLQIRYRNDFSPKWSLTAAAKWNYSEQQYRDPDYKGVEGLQFNLYRQHEYYATAAMRYRPVSPLAFSLATDGVFQTMDANLKQFARPQRYTWLTALNGKYTVGWATLNASALFTYIGEHAQYGTSAKDRFRVSPFVSLVVMPFPKEELRLRFFLKDIFRMPSFNDLYYGAVGTRNLKPERALQYNLGLTYEKNIGSFVPLLQFSADGYFNRVSDKIVAIPTKNLFVWSMVNLGKVAIRGLDVTAELHVEPVHRIRIKLNGNYTYQRALDVTGNEPGTVASKTYRHQIPYTPRVYASGRAAISTPWGELAYALLYSGKRYALGENIAANRMDPYADHSVAYRYDLPLQKHLLSFMGELLNLADKNYEIVRNFPMPGRSFRLTLTYRFN